MGAATRQYPAESLNMVSDLLKADSFNDFCHLLTNRGLTWSQILNLFEEFKPIPDVPTTTSQMDVPTTASQTLDFGFSFTNPDPASSSASPERGFSLSSPPLSQEDIFTSSQMEPFSHVFGEALALANGSQIPDDVGDDDNYYSKNTLDRLIEEGATIEVEEMPIRLQKIQTEPDLLLDLEEDFSENTAEKVVKNIPQLGNSGGGNYVDSSPVTSELPSESDYELTPQSSCQLSLVSSRQLLSQPSCTPPQATSTVSTKNLAETALQEKSNWQVSSGLSFNPLGVTIGPKTVLPKKSETQHFGSVPNPFGLMPAQLQQPSGQKQTVHQTNSSENELTHAQESPRDKYVAVPFPSAHGKRDIMTSMLDDDKCLEFQYKEKLKSGDAYTCCGCGKRIRVVNGKFMADPESLEHKETCRKKLSAVLANRLLFKTTQAIRAGELDGKPREIYLHMSTEANNMGGLTDHQRMEVLDNCKTFINVSRTFRYAREDVGKVECKKMSEVLQCDALVKSEIRNSVTGVKEDFVRFATDKQVVCFVTEIFKLAHQKGVETIVSDGCHSVAPRELDRNAQLYTVHGVAPNGATVQLLQVINTSKTGAFYRQMLGILKEQLVEAGFDLSKLCFLTDFERAAISAAKETFPDSKHGGCGFHWWMALSRNLSGTLKDCIKEEKIAADWHRRFNSLIFFPPEHLEKTGLLEPPAEASPKARQEIDKFLQYFKKTWQSGDYVGMWNKWLVKEHRTTNLAEGYHSRLLDELQSERPSLETLLKTINANSFVSYAELKKDSHNHRKGDRERKERTWGDMEAFDTLLKSKGMDGVTKEEINCYLDKMSVYVPTNFRK